MFVCSRPSACAISSSYIEKDQGMNIQIHRPIHDTGIQGRIFIAPLPPIVTSGDDEWIKPKRNLFRWCGNQCIHFNTFQSMHTFQNVVNQCIHSNTLSSHVACNGFISIHFDCCVAVCALHPKVPLYIWQFMSRLLLTSQTYLL